MPIILHGLSNHFKTELYQHPFLYEMPLLFLNTAFIFENDIAN